jgi:hypothetical protein
MYIHICKCVYVSILIQIYVHVAHKQLRTRKRARTHANTSHAPTGSRCGVCASAIRRRYTPLHWAADKGHVDVVAALLTHGADVNAKLNNTGCVFPVAVFGQRSARAAPAVADRDGRDRSPQT